MIAAASFKAIGPVRLAFAGSLALSLVVALGGSLINKDGIYYIHAARMIAEQGLGAARQEFSLQFLSILVAGLHRLSGLPLEAAAALINALFAAGTCALLVDITRRRLPEAAWAACLVALSLPAFNGLRDEILREHGFWFFALLAMWLAMRWEAQRGWPLALAVQFALLLASLFRLEAVAFFPALMLWQAFSAAPGERLKGVLTIGILPLAGALLAIVVFGAGLLPLPDRLAYFLEAANPLRKLQGFNEAAAKMAEAVFKYKYSREEAGYILFFGLLSVIPMKFLKLSGVFLVPLGYQPAREPLRAWLARWQPLPWAFLMHVIVLAAFVTHQFFLTGRYVAMLNLLAVPATAAGLVLLMRRFPRWRVLMLALAFFSMASNVVSFMPRKTQVVEAGRWLAAHAADPARVGMESARFAHYAGWNPFRSVILDKPALAMALAEGRVDMVVVEDSRKVAGLQEWLAGNGLRIVERFSNKAGDAVVIAARAEAEESRPPLPAPPSGKKKP